MKLTKRIQIIEASRTLAISKKAKEMLKNGIEIINLGVGEPDFNTPENIKNAAKLAIDNNFTKYTPVAGIEELKIAICQKLKKDNNLNYLPEQVLISNGAKQVLYSIFQALCENGEEVIIPAPCWVSYVEQIKLAGGIPKFIYGEEKNNFKITAEILEKSITPKTKLMILNSPNNPTGAVYTKEELKILASILIKHQIIVIADEIYEKIIFDTNKYISIASISPKMQDLTVIINGVSKSYSMTGWRIGYVVAPVEVIKGINNLQSHLTSNANSIAQKAALEAISGNQDSVEQMRKEFEKRRNYAFEKLNKISGIKCQKPQGAFYLFPNISYFLGKKFKDTLITDSNVLAKIILNVGKVAVIPGLAFNSDNNLRISFATSIANLEKGLTKIENILNQIK